jgi:hypothetical protein
MKRLSIRITFVIIALAAAAAVVTGDLARHAAGRKLREGDSSRTSAGRFEELYVEALWQRQ